MGGVGRGGRAGWVGRERCAHAPPPPRAPPPPPHPCCVCMRACVRACACVQGKLTMKTTEMETIYDLGVKMIEALQKEKVCECGVCGRGGRREGGGVLGSAQRGREGGGRSTGGGAELRRAPGPPLAHSHACLSPPRPPVPPSPSVPPLCRSPQVMSSPSTRPRAKCHAWDAALHAHATTTPWVGGWVGEAGGWVRWVGEWMVVGG